MLPLLAENLSNLDKITRLQNAVDALARSLYNAMHYVQFRAPMTLVNPIYPITQANVNSEEEETFKRNMKLRASEITTHVRKLHTLIDTLPDHIQTMEQFAPVYTKLLQDNKQKTGELSEAITNAEEVLVKVRDAQKYIVQQETIWITRRAQGVASASSLPARSELVVVMDTADS